VAELEVRGHASVQCTAWDLRMVASMGLDLGNAADPLAWPLSCGVAVADGACSLYAAS
jgi:hypothetical protein